MTFDSTANTVTVDIYNSGTGVTTVGSVKLNGNTISSEKLAGVPTDFTFVPGAVGTITITYTSVVPGNKYSLSLFQNDGTLIGSFTDTA